MRRSAVRAIAPLTLMALIFYFSAQEDIPGDPAEWEHVVGHFSEYALLAALWIWALAPRLGRGAIVAAAAISLVYAVSDELHQSYVPGRAADPLDVLADACGIAFAVVLALAVSRARSRRTARRAPAPPA